MCVCARARTCVYVRVSAYSHSPIVSVACIFCFQLPVDGERTLASLFQLSMDQGFALLKQYQHHVQLPRSMVGVTTSLREVLTSLLEYICRHGGFGKAHKNKAGNSQDQHSSGKKDTDDHLKSLGDAVPELLASGTASAHVPGDSLKSFVTVFSRMPGLLSSTISKLYIMAYTWVFGSYFQLVSIWENKRCCFHWRDFAVVDMK